MRVIQALVSIVVIAPFVMIIILQGFLIVGPVTGMPVSECPCIQPLHHTIGSLAGSRETRQEAIPGSASDPK